MKLLFKPFGMVAGLVASRASTALFDQVWQRVDGGELPDADVREDPAGRAILAAALQAAIFAGTSAAVSRYGMHVFEHTFGTWPGDHREIEPASSDA
jgi:hypothetical protein